MPARRLDSAYLSALLDASPGIVMVTDENVQLTWANEAATTLLGYDLDEVLGRSILDFLDTDWNPAAFESIATAMASHGMRPPMLFRVLAKDGTRPIIEAQANVQLEHPTISGVVTYARRWTTQWLLDRTLDSVAAGEPIAETLRLLVSVVGAEPMDAPASFVFDPVGNRVAGVVASPELPVELTGPVADTTDEVAAAWAPLLREPIGRVHAVDELAEPLRTIATAAGHVALWLWPTGVDQAEAPIWAIAWRNEPHLDADETRTGMMSRLSTIGAFALARWRTEMANEYAATHDTMTGLWNRAGVIRHIEELLDHEPSGPSASSAGVVVAYLDLDEFKPVNDRYGHAAGDRVLSAVAERLRAAAPAEGRMGRFGGDEFVYVGPAEGIDDAHRLGERFAAAIDGPIELRTGELVRIGGSVGCSYGEPGTSTVDELLDRADRALYRAKRGSATG